MTADANVNKISVLSAILKESQGAMTYEAWVPSLKKTITLRMMTTGMFTTISKYAVVSENLEFQKALLALINELQVVPEGQERLDVSQITDSDRVSIILSIVLNNCPEKLVQEITCDKCEEKFSYDTNLAEIIGKVREVPPDVIKNYEIPGHKLTVTLGLPVMQVNLTYIAMVNAALEAKEKKKAGDEELRKMEIEYTTLVPMLMVKSIFLDGEDTGFSQLSLPERIEVIKALPKKAFIDMLELSTGDDYNPAQLMYRNISCPKCGNGIEYDMDVRYFFI